VLSADRQQKYEEKAAEPHAYFDYLYTHLPEATSVEQLEALLPWNVKPLLQRSLTPRP